MSKREHSGGDVRLVFPDGITTNQARRLADIGDDLAPLGATDLIDAKLYNLKPPQCECCDRLLEAGYCYACKPVMGYGEGFRCEKCSAQEDEAEFKRQARRAGIDSEGSAA